MKLFKAFAHSIYKLLDMFNKVVDTADLGVSIAHNGMKDLKAEADGFHETNKVARYKRIKARRTDYELYEIDFKPLEEEQAKADAASA